MVVASIAMPNWIDYAVTTAKGDTIHKTIGLHKSCSTLDGGRCSPYPTAALCQSGQRYFCTMWRTTGWLASFSVVLGLAGLVAFAVTLGGGKYKRESGWPFVGGLIATFSAVQLIVISVVVSSSSMRCNVSEVEARRGKCDGANERGCAGISI